MKYNFDFFFIRNCFLNLVKFGKIESNYFKLKKNILKIKKMLSDYFKKNIKIYIIKKKYKKGDFSIIGEVGIFFYKKFIFLKNEKK